MRESNEGVRLSAALWRGIKPIAKQVVFRSLVPTGPGKAIFAALYELSRAYRDASLRVRRTFIATPVFLSQCESHGRDVVVDGFPYLTGPCRIRVGNRVHIAGTLLVLPSGTDPLLTLGDGVVVGDMTTFAVASRIEIGNDVRIGSHCYLADTEGHSRRAANKPSWEVPPDPEDIGPVIIEDGASIADGCTVLRGVRIGAGARVGPASVVRMDVPPGTSVLGNPARPVKTGV